jgi:hypothetical protein
MSDLSLDQRDISLYKLLHPEQILQNKSKNEKKKKSQKLADKIVRHMLKHSPVDVESFDDVSRFGDPNISKRFVWRKKIETALEEKDVDLQKFSLRSENERKYKQRQEINRIKLKREYQEKDKHRIEEEIKLVERARAVKDGNKSDWIEKEHFFQNAKLRAEIRLRQGRPEPLDLIIKNLLLSDQFGMDSDPPHLTCSKLTLQKLEHMAHDTKIFSEMVNCLDTFNVEFWHLLSVILDCEIEMAKKIEAPDTKHKQVLGVNSQVSEDIKLILTSKTSEELEELETEIKKQLNNNCKSNSEFWNDVLLKLEIQKANNRLEKMHSELFANFLKKHQLKGHIEYHKTNSANSCSVFSGNLFTPEKLLDTSSILKTNQKFQNFIGQDKEISCIRNQNKASGMSPKLMSVEHFDCEELLDVKQDIEEINFRRSLAAYKAAEKIQIANSSKNNPTLLLRADSAENHRYSKEVNDSSIVDFNKKVCSKKERFICMKELQRQSQVHWWHDKYRHRKPRYFNRIHTGYEWNKYNQTHHDSENPPPKVVLGYKFNIFYPDLIDKNTVPQYFVDKNPDDICGSTCIIRFHAGPPYEDIAFKILNKQWEMLPKKGFRCLFEKSVLHLYFNFTKTYTVL